MKWTGVLMRVRVCACVIVLVTSGGHGAAEGGAACDSGLDPMDDAGDDEEPSYTGVATPLVRQHTCGALPLHTLLLFRRVKIAPLVLL